MIAPKERNAVPPATVQREKVLLVEGDTPSHFFEALANHLGIADQVEIRNYGGITQLATFLRTLASTADFRNKVKSLGIARDAEKDVEAARESVDHAVKAAGLSNQVSVKVEILPNDGPGMIETLCVRSIEGHPSHSCIESFLGCLKGKHIQLPEGIIIAKHFAQAHLIAMDWPQLMPGLAAYKDIWPFEAPTFSSLKAFLLSL